MKSRMKEAYRDDEHPSTGPRVMRKRSQERGRSVDRGRCRRAIEPRNQTIRAADAVKRGGRPHRDGRHGESGPEPARSETLRMHRNFMDGNWEIPGFGGWRKPAAACSEGHWSDGCDERPGEVGRVRSICETCERSPAPVGLGGGAGGEKGLGQEEPSAGRHIPDAVPETRCVPRPEPGARESKTGSEDTVHLAVPSPAPAQIATRL